ncbi:hypothetical protein Tco_0761418, partial [Tanacetum coccineum]
CGIKLKSTSTRTIIHGEFAHGETIAQDYGIWYVVDALSSPRTYNEIPTLRAYPMCETVPCDQIDSVSKLVDKGSISTKEFCSCISSRFAPLWRRGFSSRSYTPCSPALIALEADKNYLEEQRHVDHVVDYGVGLLGSLQAPPMAQNYGHHIQTNALNKVMLRTITPRTIFFVCVWGWRRHVEKKADVKYDIEVYVVQANKRTLRSVGGLIGL